MESVTVAQSLGAVDGYFLHLLAALALAVVFSALYIRITPYAEFRLITEGKVAPAISFSGALLGFVIPLAGAISQSVSFLDMLVWGMISLLVQVLVFIALRACFSGLCRAIVADQVASGILLGVLSLAAGILNAACMID